MADHYIMNFNTRDLPGYNSDFIILGSGIAGFFTAILAGRLGAGVTVLTKQTILDSNTDKAQGGIAAAMDTEDSPELHYQDTLRAGAGLCDRGAVRILVNEGPRRVLQLMDMGARFDVEGGRLALTREGAHSCRRILHASGDATGAEIQRVLNKQALAEKNIEVLEQHFAVDLLVRDNVCYGVLAYDYKNDTLKVYRSRAVILATGGVGQLYAHSTNPEVATGDGIAMAYRAGAEVMDMEFLQFHPTVLNLPGAPRFLISEAVRGEGAYLRNGRGERFMPRYHELAELAPRDIVVRAILEEMQHDPQGGVFLDLSHLDTELVLHRFPNINRTCKGYGLDITRDMIPVAPAAHYMMGGVKTNYFGETTIERLYACGEAACQGVHGANRLASNSLLDGLVFGGRIVERTAGLWREKMETRVDFAAELPYMNEPLDCLALQEELQALMSRYAGPLRDRQGLEKVLSYLSELSDMENTAAQTPRQAEMRNRLMVSRLVAETALMRTESRGGHFRRDYPRPRKSWLKHIILRK
ncbi:L-aspartate oxidase [Desulfoscipio geothermicus]|uniref:L-aspartate oxidase n=1 Tax=Desulfoscipio geothermicus DSM 3669 TaxID=1121426 RepID=A0A1I6DVC9_9FIRM|nr:L-aspartate oxidase [Desulfoscipio geothermicus]SFR09302.1 L-aspartate oxidase [Desulfoscipio geothermicus DSM 3669]